MDPLELSRELLRRYSVRDLDGLIEMFSEDVNYRRTDGRVLVGREAVRAQYETDWSMTENAQATLVRGAVAHRTVFAEVAIGSDHPVKWQLDAVAVHDWSTSGTMSNYRLYSDAPRLIT